MSGPVRCRVGDVVRRGRTIAVREPVDPDALARAVRTAPEPDARVAVTADPPGPAHEFVGCIESGMGLRARTALAAAARTRGLETPHDDALAEARKQLADLDAGRETRATGERRAEIRQVAADATGEREELREAVAAARGRLQARREQGLDPTPAAEALAAAIEQLSEAETDAAAARQRLETTRERTREHRDSRERRFRLEDRIANLERRARAHLREQVHDEYVTALDAVPGGGDIEHPFETDPVTAALAVARVADLSAPVVLACDRFASPAGAANWLNAPVLVLSDRSGE
jgi:hypothetical protein